MHALEQEHTTLVVDQMLRLLPSSSWITLSILTMWVKTSRHVVVYRSIRIEVVDSESSSVAEPSQIHWQELSDAASCFSLLTVTLWLPRSHVIACVTLFPTHSCFLWLGKFIHSVGQTCTASWSAPVVAKYNGLFPMQKTAATQLLAAMEAWSDCLIENGTTQVVSNTDYAFIIGITLCTLRSHLGDPYIGCSNLKSILCFTL